MPEELFYYLLFPNHHEGLKLYNALKEAGVGCTITPTPRFASRFCGIALRVRGDLLEAVRGVIADSGVRVEGVVPDNRER